MAQAAFKIEDAIPACAGMPAIPDEAGRKPVDLAHLARQTLGDVGLEREILSLFVVQSQVYLLRLQAAETVEEWRRAAHTIKGSARGIGAWSLAEVAEAAEGMGGDIHDAAHIEMAATVLQRICAANAYVRELFDACEG
ncbi:MAG: Hpt domain-containing protein [Rhodobiaceae bacterium]|nr:Hpt domain-containing protein [Rhodobiaceae bacterium]MCC0016842.1 Hpt domain-containing protein [Rhodobiaceae bacterium]MCC0041462.1 Hpt domain-containing protein [Rhodobiaceae bacterium]